LAALVRRAPLRRTVMQTLGGDTMGWSRRPDYSRHTILVTLCCATVTIGVAVAGTIEDLKLSPESVAPQCSPVDGEYAISIQARTHYSMVEQYPPTLFKLPARKAYQSFVCSKAKSTLYYYEYATKDDLETARGFTESLIWGEKGPTREHPDLIIPFENVLVIISSRDPGFFKNALQKKR
jgi:hypothetical protein